ncbi:phage tail protein I [Roseobacter sp. GAI101]|uniref:phage tail protein I n=1 Tax=Roseobacter sp. (strain GAI101) TaxID=391589 RepID=UPI000306D614|nr:phage tail protein I [Roseobacter sp. GAI101]
MSDLLTVLPPSAQQIERDLEQLSGRLRGFGDPIAALWNASVCPEHLLSYLAWAFSIEIWDSAWPVEQKRRILIDAVQVHRVKGTVGSVRRALAGIGVPPVISEWFDYGGEPHTFRIDFSSTDVFAAGLAIDPRTLEIITSILVNLKPQRSHFAVRIGEDFGTEVYMRASARGRLVSEIGHDPVPRTRASDSSFHLRSGARQRQLSVLTHDVQRRDAA